MGIFKAFQKANQVIEGGKKDVAKGRKNKGNDEVSQQRAKKQGKK